MFILLILVTSLLILLISLMKKKDVGIPICPGKWPILGHIPMLIGDNVKLYNNIDMVSTHAIENGGYSCLQLGIFRNYYFFTDPDDISVILNATTEKHYLYSFANTWLGKGLLTAPPHIWKTKKKLLYPMFQQQNLNKFLTVFNNQSRRLVRQFSHQIGKGPFDHESDVLLISMETICQTAVGLDVGEEMARNTEFVAAIEILLDSIVARLKKVWLHLEPIYELSSVKKIHDENLKIVHNLTKEGQKFKGEFQPFVDTIFKISSENENFNDKDVIDEVNTLLVAGYDTTASALGFTLMLLGHYQDVQDKVYEELQTVFDNTDRDVDKYDLSKLVYLEAVIKESLRLYSTAPAIARKVKTDLKLKKYAIPAGTDCFISFYGLHRNPEWGKDARIFNPDRWMNPETLPKNPNLFAPFGGGKRYCAGKTYAMMSLKTTLAHVIRHYIVKADMSKLVLQMMVLLKAASGHEISLEPRETLNTANYN